ncbi:MAG: dihydropteroate synthase [Bacteroidota bacterium]|nr:dihydropteroate synthase [Bacteroidota bacterium]
MIKVKGGILDLGVPKVMGILNLTPDSFFDGGKYQKLKNILLQVEKMLSDGADIIDVGGFSSRPGAKLISEDEELQRVVKPIKNICNKFPDAIISIDTFRSTVAQKTIDAGACIVNDITAGNGDNKMFDVIKRNDIPYILMHMQGNSGNMQDNPKYEDVVKEIIRYFESKIQQLKQMGIKDFLIDPGFGFGKTIAHNYEILRNLELLKLLDAPVLVGVSRKSMINKALNIKAQEALNGTTVLNTIALLKGANILRVHDVKEAKETIKLVTLHLNQK